MPLDPMIEGMLAQQPEWPPVRDMPIDALRASVHAASVAMPPPDVTLASISDRTIPGPGGDIPVRIYKPEGTGNRFPAAPDDCYAAVRWASANAAELGGDSERIAVAGDSAGGVLANALAIQSMVENGPRIAAVVNWYGPCIHPVPEGGTMAEFEHGPILRADDVRYFHELYVTGPADDADYRASPIKAESHAGLPPHFIASAECDPIRDAVEMYAPELRDAGVEVELKRYPGMVHGFVSWLAFLPGAQAAMADACSFLKRQFAVAKEPA
jgi:acetyl esterase